MDTTLTRLRQTIRQLEDQQHTFHQTLERQINSAAFLTSDQQLALRKARLNHSQIHLLSQVNQAGELPYKTLTQEVAFSQGMLSRYVNKLIELDLLRRVNLPDNNKAYNLTVTATGAKIAQLHDALHQRQDELMSDALVTFSPKELRTTMQVLDALGTVTLDQE